MHELAVAQDIMDTVLAERQRRNLGAVHIIRVTAAAMSCVDPEALKSAFEVLTEGSELEGVRLEVTKLPMVAVCDRCGAGFDPRAVAQVCPTCGVGRLNFSGETAIIVDSLEVEENA